MNIELFAVNYSDLDFRNLGFGKDKKKSIENIDFKIKPILKARYFTKVGLVELSSYGGKIKFEFLVLKIQILFSRHMNSSLQGRLS